MRITDVIFSMDFFYLGKIYAIQIIMDHIIEFSSLFML